MKTYRITLLIKDEIAIKASKENTFLGYPIESLKEIDYDIDLENFIKSCGIKVHNDGTHECKNCDGSGQAYRWEDRDPIEGYKMATKHTCTRCKGTKIQNNNVYLDSYKMHIEKIAKEKELMQRVNILKEHYSEADINFIISNKELFK